jgi:hypothetical protein
MSHHYNVNCVCSRCIKERARRTAQSVNDPRNVKPTRTRIQRWKPATDPIDQGDNLGESPDC